MKTALFWLGYAIFVVAFLNTVLSWARMWYGFYKEVRDRKEGEHENR